MDNTLTFSKDGLAVIIGITRKNGDRHFAIYDRAYHALLKHLTFCCHAKRHRSNEFYAATRVNGKVTLMHRLVAGMYCTDEHFQIDHIRKKPVTVLDEHGNQYTVYPCMDNRSSNLRLVSCKENQMNRHDNHLQHDIPVRQPWIHTVNRCHQLHQLSERIKRERNATAANPAFNPATA